MLERLKGTALLRFRVGKSCSNLQMHSPSSWLSADQFHYCSDGPGFCWGQVFLWWGVKLPICTIRCGALLDCCRVLLKKTQVESLPYKVWESLKWLLKAQGGALKGPMVWQECVQTIWLTKLVVSNSVKTLSGRRLFCQLQGRAVPCSGTCKHPF